MGDDRESGFHERARSGPIHEYVVALRETWAPAKRLGATQTELARRGPFTEGTVSKYFSGGLIATDKFVDTLLTFVTTPPYGTVSFFEMATDQVTACEPQRARPPGC
ncbi:hypothetical protein [Streptomyces griseoaurantiacus]|uniref:Helix-turn-helix n=1 Tax=Streptomyces griseoaurantiacus TaxID=68213 RepID=A0A1G7YHK5_9ACTN|nr:hypothetical protein [Streptomyces jietaisiensis]SDG95877.1 hypothetical protein SAMN05216260_1416 [Streptomyces jietaisiensis]